MEACSYCYPKIGIQTWGVKSVWIKKKHCCFFSINENTSNEMLTIM